MKLIVKLVILSFGVLFIINALLPPRYLTAFDVERFSQLPVQANGRVQPLSSVAGNALLILSGKRSLSLPNGQYLNANTWLLEVVFRPNVADTLPVFRIDHDQVLGLFGWRQEQKHFSFVELQPHFEQINEQARNIPAESQRRNSFERAIMRLHDSLTLYHSLVYTFRPVIAPSEQLLDIYAAWQASIIPGLEAVRRQQLGEPFDQPVLASFMAQADHYLSLAKTLTVRIVPPMAIGDRNPDDWSNIGQAMLDMLLTQQLSPTVAAYANLLGAYNDNQPEVFNKKLRDMAEEYVGHVAPWRLASESFFNTFEPFYQSIILYLCAFFLVAISWLVWPKTLRESAYLLLILAFLVHTLGLVARMYIQMRPPVTNLYSSAIFVGWVAVLLGLLVERFHRNGLGSAIAALIGFSTLIIAHQLGMSGDTLEMMRAVLDSNFWLATHVVTVTMGYAAMFLAGGLGIAYVLRGVFTSTLTIDASRALRAMVYGILCFALLFSFVGTMLGGIWADQSWGRFWGWDPKENGALLIVLWVAVVLHARWGQLIEERGLMVLAIFGNIVTSWSWFGVNMLGVGLHSYGFMDQAFMALMIFMLSQFSLMILGLLPYRYWQSYPQPK